MKLRYFIISSLILFLFINCSSKISKNNEINDKYGLNSEQYEYVKNETIPGGKLDFEQQLEDKQLFLIGSVAYNKRDAALFTWGQAMKRLGVRSANDAINLYEDIKTIKLKEPQTNAIKNGFNKELKE